MNDPSAVATHDTLEFVLAHLDPGRRRLLEVGCGAGELAAELTRAGHEVVAIDSDAEAVRAARARGVEALATRWPWPELGRAERGGTQVGTPPGGTHRGEAPFDAILFTRSLHHVSPLDAAVACARALVRPRGVVLVEDFAYADADERAVAWLFETLDLLERTPAWRAPSDGLAAALLRDGPRLELWQREHDHDLHSAAAMTAALAAALALERADPAPYLYRYLVPCLEATPRGAAVLARVMAHERKLIAAATLPAIGRRFVARRQ